MGRTIHRTPLTVNTNPGIKYEFFNHSNWNGLCDDKNYLNVNQETFEDCNNVYIDENNLLKSRPSLKIQPELNTGDNINNVWKFDDITCWIDFLIQDDAHLYINDGTATKRHYLSSQKINIFKYGDRIFVFTNDSTFYIDNYLNLVPADDFIYLPVRYTYVNGVRSEKVVETDNLLTSGYKERFVYNNIDKITNPTYRNKTVTVDADGEKKTYEFVDGAEDLIFFKQFTVTERNYLNEELLLDVSDVGNMILSEYSETIDRENGIVRYWTIKHSIDGKIFTEIESPTGKVHGRPIISRNGTFAVVFKDDGPYALSLLPSTANNVLIFSTWTNLLRYNNIDTDDVTTIGENYLFPPSEVRNVNDVINGYFVDEHTFSFVVGSNPSVRFNELYFYSAYLYFVEDGILYERLLVSQQDRDYTNTIPYIKLIKLNDEYYNVYLLGRGVNTSFMYVELYSFDTDKRLSKYIPVNKVYNPMFFDIKVTSDDSLRLIIEGGIYNINSLSNDTIGSPDIILTRDDIYKFYGTNIITNNKYLLSPDYTKSISINVDYVYVNNNALWTVVDNVVYNNLISNNFVTVDVIEKGSNIPNVFEMLTELNSLYGSINDTLYISLPTSDDTDDKKLLYFPKINNQKFDKKITNLHPVSESQVAIFFDDQIWYSQITEQGYAYYKSKLQVGLANGADVITSPDGKNIIFSTERGLVYLGYQELVQSTEQTLTFLSDAIQTHWKEFISKPVKLLLYKYWLYCYNENEPVMYVFDIRNNSWWKWTFPDGVIKIKHIVIPMFIVNKSGGTVMKLDDRFENYFDYDNNLIDWHFTSQKLHLGTLNYYKNVMSIIINNVEYEDVKHDVSYNLDIKNYRITSSYRYEEPKNFTYKVDMLRTFVKRCNSRKLNEFQYTLSSDTGDNGDVIQLPLSIHSIIIKYTVSGQVR